MTSARSIARALVPPVVVDARRNVRKRRWGRKPFSTVETFSEAYLLNRDTLIARLVQAKAPLDELQLLGRSELARIDERAVEYSWAFEQLRARPGGRLLDVGCVLNQSWSAPHLAELFSERWYLNITFEALHDGDRASMIVADARDVPLPTGYFDVVTCLSSLEHVGMDNSIYTGDETYRATDDNADLWSRAEPAVREMRRLVRPGGLVLVTVPFGQSEDHGWFQVFDAERIDQLCGALGTGCRTEVFRVTPGEGWRRARVEDAADASYGQDAVAAAALACVSCDVPRDS